VDGGVAQLMRLVLLSTIPQCTDFGVLAGLPRESIKGVTDAQGNKSSCAEAEIIIASK
jgi:hypothetical protein